MKLKLLCFMKSLKDLESSEYFPLFFYCPVTVGNKYISRNQAATLDFLRTWGTLCALKMYKIFSTESLLTAKGHVFWHCLRKFAFKPNDLLISVLMHSFFWNTGIKVENSYNVRSVLVSLADIKLPIAPNVNIKWVTKFHVTSLMDLHSRIISVKDLCIWKWVSLK